MFGLTWELKRDCYLAATNQEPGVSSYSFPCTILFFFPSLPSSTSSFPSQFFPLPYHCVISVFLKKKKTSKQKVEINLTRVYLDKPDVKDSFHSQMNTLYSLINMLSFFLACSQMCDILIEKQHRYIIEDPMCESQPDGLVKKAMLLNNCFLCL